MLQDSQYEAKPKGKEMRKLQQTSGTRPRTPETKTRLLTLIAWEYGPNAAGAFSVWTASFLTIVKEINHI